MTVAVLIVLGLCFGSFANAFVWRLHEQHTNKKLSKKRQKELSIVHGRSMCPHCRHVLAWYDLLPVISWMSLAGKCRYCHRKIDDSPLVELVTAVVFAGSYVVWPYGFAALGVVLFTFWLVFLVGFIVLTVYDLRWMLLPNRVVYPLMGLILLQLGTRLVMGDDARNVLVEAFWGFMTVGGLFYALFHLSRGKWIGGGDVKLGFIIGPLVGGPLNSILLVFIASLLGTFISIPFLAKKTLKPTSRIPFGPFLLIATMAVYLYGNRLADWYISSFL